MASQFGAAKNPPWARPASVAPEFITAVTAASSMPNVTPTSLAQAQVGSALLNPSVATPPVYSLGNPGAGISQPQYSAQMAALGIQQAQLQQAAAAAAAAAVLPQPGIAIPTTLATSQVATVSYPPPRITQPQGQQKQRVFTGTVTKLHDNFGFVDEDVFFQTTCVKGSVPKVGSRVLVEATYNPNMPFKWNATRIQVLANQNAPGLSSGLKGAPQLNLNPPGVSIPQPVPPVGHVAPNQIITQSIAGPVLSQQPPPLMAQNPQPSMGLLPGSQRSGGPPPHRNDQSRFQGMKNREKERERERERDRRDRKENRLKRQRSPNLMVKSPVPRPRSPIRRRQTRVIPRYVVQIPKLSFDTKGANVVTLKSRYNNMYIPSDFFNASFSWAEVFPVGRNFRLGSHCQFHIMQKDVEPLQPNDAILDPPDVDHQYSAKVMLLASPRIEELYQKSCTLAQTDTESFQHPTRLLQFLVGVRGKNEPMAIGGAWSPSLDGPNPAENPQVLIKTAIRTTKALTGIDLSSCTQWYRFAEIAYLRPETNHKGRQVPARVETVVLFLPDVWTCSPTRLEWGSLQVAYSKQLQRKIAVIEGSDPAQGDDDNEEEKGDVEEKTDPTHHSLLDPKTMKIVDLRRELECRNLSSKGLKSQLIARLTKTLKQEKEDEDEVKQQQPQAVSVKVADEIEEDEKEPVKKKVEEEDKKLKEKREKAAVERKYCLPNSSAIIVHPSATAKSGKFDCSMMSLSVLLDYRPEDNKEHSFEVSLFAELFNEMLMRDFGYQIYRTLVLAPPKKEEDKKDEKKDEKKDDKKDKKEDPKEPAVKKMKSEDGEDKAESGGKDVCKKGEETEEHMDMEEANEDENEDAMKNEDGKKDKDKKDKDKKKDKRKYATTDPALLLAFVYFDQNHTGYLLDKDVEEVIHTLGLHLSRAQVKKLVQKVVSRDTLNYRKLTDKPIPAEGEAKKEDASPVQGPVISEDEIAKGNTDYLRQVEPHPVSEPTKTPERPGTRSTPKGSKTESPASNIIHYKGALVDIDSLMQRLEKSEKSRGDLEKKMEEMSTEMFSMKSSLNTSEYSCQKLGSELRQVKTELEKENSLREQSDSLNKKWTTVVSESKDTIASALAAMSSLLEGNTNVKVEKVEASTEDGEVKTEKK